MNKIRKLWDAWLHFGRMLGDIIGRVLLTIFYFTLFAPFGIGVRLAADPLDMKTKPTPSWLPRQTNDLTLDDSRRIF